MTEPTPVVTEPTPPPIVSAPAVTGPETYEECITLIGQLENESDVSNLKAGLKKLASFFARRVGKKKREEDRDGGAAVKRTIAASRNFKKYEPKAIDAATVKSPFA